MNEEPKEPKEPKDYGKCRGLTLLRQKMRERGISVSQLARHLDRSWDYAKGILEGTTRPDVDDVAVMRERYGVPAEAWRQ